VTEESKPGFCPERMTGIKIYNMNERAFRFITVLG
jgi:hypothetical protein